MFGWLSEEASFASRSKRASAPGVGREPRRQELERDVAVELEVVRAVHDAHPARAELVLDRGSAGDRLADHRDLMIAAGNVPQGGSRGRRTTADGPPD